MHLVTAVYPDAAAATETLERAKAVAHDEMIELLDGAVAVRNEDGRVAIHHQLDRRTGGGAVGGTLCGLFLAAMFPPAAIAEVLFGAVGGAVGGHFSGHANRQEFRAVADGIEAGKAAVILLLDDDGDAGPLLATVADADHVADDALSRDESEKLRLAF